MIDRGSWKVVDFEKTYVYMFVKRIWNTKQKVRMFLGYMLILAAYMSLQSCVHQSIDSQHMPRLNKTVADRMARGRA